MLNIPTIAGPDTHNHDVGMDVEDDDGRGGGGGANVLFITCVLYLTNAVGTANAVSR